LLQAANVVAAIAKPIIIFFIFFFLSIAISPSITERLQAGE
jgi:hypothetical protein